MEMKATREEERRLWRRQHQQRNDRRGTPFPQNLSIFPPFSEWLEDDVKSALTTG